MKTRYNLLFAYFLLSCLNGIAQPRPSVVVKPAEKVIVFEGYVDCNMAEVWIKDTFRIFSGKYGKDPVWGDADLLRYASGTNPEQVFSTPWVNFEKPVLPLSVDPHLNGLHGAVWFETIYKDRRDPSEKTLYALYHNELYPKNYPYNPVTGEGYLPLNWPEGLLGDTTEAAVCRIGIMKSTDGGKTWIDKGIILEDKQPRMILKPHNTSLTFAGGVGDPSAVASGNYLYVFYGEYGYAGVYDPVSYKKEREWEGQCISVARIPLSDLDNPAGKAKRWDGKSFSAPYDGIGKPISALQIPMEEGGGPASAGNSKFYWGPSVSWNSYLQCWVMLMARAEAPKWVGSAIYISFNFNKDLGKSQNSQEWTKPQLLINKPGDIIWYPSLQPTGSPDDITQKNSSTKLGRRARLYYKYFPAGKPDLYLSEFEIEFTRSEKE